MVAATVTKHACARCGKKQPAERMVYSRHTRRRFCMDFVSCDRRVKRGNALIDLRERQT